MTILSDIRGYLGTAANSLQTSVDKMDEAYNDPDFMLAPNKYAELVEVSRRIGKLVKEFDRELKQFEPSVISRKITGMNGSSSPSGSNGSRKAVNV